MNEENKASLQEMCDSIEGVNVNSLVIGAEEGPENVKGVESLNTEIIIENFPNVEKDT
jgi:hypothetical protein